MSTNEEAITHLQLLNKRLTKSLTEAVDLYESYGLLANGGMRVGAWINEARDNLKLNEMDTPQLLDTLASQLAPKIQDMMKNNPQANFIWVIKLIREETGFGLNQAKSFAENYFWHYRKNLPTCDL